MKIDHFVWTIHGEQPVCKCGLFMYLLGDVPEKAEWVCIKCRPDKLKGQDKNG